jgi:hypothetical protein
MHTSRSCDYGAVEPSQELPGAAGELYRFIFADVPVDEWNPSPGDHPAEPWVSFERARQFARSGQPTKAVALWEQIALTDGVPSRVSLQAWHFVRQAGHTPPADLTRRVLGAVAEVPVNRGHDVLAAYQDGTARYLNYAGGAVIWDDPHPEIQAAIDVWLATAQELSDRIGTWEQPTLPPLPAGHLRLLMLTPGGPRFGQGPAAGLQADPAANRFLAHAAALMHLLTRRAADTP